MPLLTFHYDLCPAQNEASSPLVSSDPLCGDGALVGHVFVAETPVRIPHFNGHSHLEFQGLGRTVLVFTELEAVIKPESMDGLILYNGYTHDRKGDFIALSLRQGHVEFTFDLGTGPAVIR